MGRQRKSCRRRGDYREAALIELAIILGAVLCFTVGLIIGRADVRHRKIKYDTKLIQEITEGLERINQGAK